MPPAPALPGFLSELISDPGKAFLGPGPRPGIKSRAEIDAAMDRLGTQSTTAACIRALLLEWNDHHDPAHAIVQDRHDADGSLIHGILHRREPDYSNARYWFEKTGPHPSFEALSRALASGFDWGSQVALRNKILRRGEWDPDAMIGACEDAADLGLEHARVQCLMAVQEMETMTLLRTLL